jgi:hypothetical protein
MSFMNIYPATTPASEAKETTIKTNRFFFELLVSSCETGAIGTVFSESTEE